MQVADPIDADEATARGAAIQAAAVALGVPVTDIRQKWAPSTQVMAEPRPGTEHIREWLFDRYLRAADWDGLDDIARTAQSVTPTRGTEAK